MHSSAYDLDIMCKSYKESFEYILNLLYVVFIYISRVYVQETAMGTN